MNLLEEEFLTEIHVVFPTSGRPKLFATKMDAVDAPTIMRITQGLVEAAVDFARLYGVQIQGQIGGPPPPPNG